jgi:hypothetical protein
MSLSALAINNFRKSTSAKLLVADQRNEFLRVTKTHNRLSIHLYQNPGSLRGCQSKPQTRPSEKDIATKLKFQWH